MSQDNLEPHKPTEAIVCAETIAKIDRIEKRQIDQALALLCTALRTAGARGTTLGTGGESNAENEERDRDLTASNRSLSCRLPRCGKMAEVDLTQQAAGNTTNTCRVLQADAIVAPPRNGRPRALRAQR
jgi:hypothetical protein